jgi:rhodanese-related sulfurtransferase
MALDNALHGNPLMTPARLVEMQQKGESIQVIDTRSAKDFEKSHVQDAIHVPLGELRARAGELSKDIPTVTYCNKGVTGNAAQNILINLDFKEVYNLSGGNKNYQSYLIMLKRKN